MNGTKLSEDQVLEILHSAGISREEIFREYDNQLSDAIKLGAFNVASTDSLFTTAATLLLRARLHDLAVSEAQVRAAYDYAELLSGFCSPHGIAVDYSQQLTKALDDAKALIVKSGQ